ncbi:MAG TPA: hypothetical protein VLB50_03995 [Ignavibacteriaceae bacterium]|nr:hypothetical protein [Ignavibacteriaceae bacterium]
MKALILSGFCMMLLFSSCSKEEKKLEVFNAEAFAYDLGGSWEVDASVRVKGFKQNEKDSEFTATLSYEIDLVKPAGDTVKALISKTEDKFNNEEFMDTPLEVQFDLDSTYADGDYKLIFNVKDAETGKMASASAPFNLKKD